MNKRLLLLLGTAGLVAAVAVGISAAATRSDGTTSKLPAKKGSASATSTSGAPVGKPVSTTESGNAGQYWTPDRMQKAAPMDKSPQGGPSGASSPSRTGKTTQGLAPPAMRSQKTAKMKTAAAAGPVGAPTSMQAKGNAGSYWDAGTMANAQPMDKTLPGGNASTGSGSSGSAVPGSGP